MSEQELPQSATETTIDREYTCTNCHRGFDASMTHQIVILNENEAELMCSWCKHTDTYQPPDDDEIERPPAIVNHTVGQDSEGHPIARAFFEGGAWLQYRKAPDEWVYEEMFTPAGEKAASYKAEFEREDCGPPREYLHRELDRYEKYTVRGLGIQRTHIAAILGP